VQTSARKDSIEENMNKSSIWGVPMVWAVENEEAKNIILNKNDVMSNFIIIK